jgi:hypothetical protein
MFRCDVKKLQFSVIESMKIVLGRSGQFSGREYLQDYVDKKLYIVLLCTDYSPIECFYSKVQYAVICENTVFRSKIFHLVYSYRA